MSKSPEVKPSTDAAPEEAKFVTGNLMSHVVSMAFTASIGLMAIFAVDLVDLIFISMLGSSALAAAVGYAGTLMFFTTSISIGLSVAAGALVSKAIGAGKLQDAREFATSVMMAGLMGGLVAVGFVFYYRSELLGLLGAVGETKELAITYLNIVLPSTPVLMVAMVANAVLRAHGDAKRAMLAVVAGGVVNAIFDPLLIFGLGLGLQGAAFASVLANLAICVASLIPVIRVYKGVSMPSEGLFRRDFVAMSAIAVPAVLTNIASPVGSALVTREMAKFGTEAVAGMAIIGRLTPFAFAMVFAVSGAVGPIIGQNFGARLPDRVRGAVFAGLRFITIYGVVMAGILFLLRALIGDLFDAQGQTLTLIFLFCGPLALFQIFNGWLFVSNATMNNLGHPIYSTWTNWGRHTLGTWPLAVFGASMWGASGVLIGQAVGGLVFAVIGVWLATRVIKRTGAEMLAEPHEPEAESEKATQENFREHARWHLLHHSRV